jgi:hypothetical protein
LALPGLIRVRSPRDLRVRAGSENNFYVVFAIERTRIEMRTPLAQVQGLNIAGICRGTAPILIQGLNIFGGGKAGNV